MSRLNLDFEELAKQEPTPSQSRREYLANLTDLDLHNLLAENELALRNVRVEKDATNLNSDRDDLLDEMKRRPDFNPKGTK
jgi:hypothetical protein